MKHGTLRGLLAGAVFAGFSLGVFADVKENPYQVIIERNPFGLKPIPPPPVPVVDTNPPPVEVEVKLTGISNLTGSPKAFIELIETKTKKTERPPPMIVGDKQGDLEILSIDPNNYTVRIRKGGAETTLDFEKNGYKLGTAVAGGAPVPHIPGMPPVPQPIPGIPNVQNPNSGVVVGGGGGNPGAPGATFAGNTAVPSRPVRTENVVAGGGGQGIAPPPPKQLTIDEARQIIELRRQEMERQRPGSSIILPPTGLTPPQQPDAQQAPVPNVPAPTPFRRF